MSSLYVRRYRMEAPLANWPAETPSADDSPYALLPWNPAQLDLHADVKFRSFVGEMDATVFSCLGHRDGCGRLMAEIARRQGFVPEATWLIAHQPSPEADVEYCGTIQGIEDPHFVGLIQNLGVVSSHRGKRLGERLLRYALSGFKKIGCRTASLEVTAANTPAVALYRRLGFEIARTVYKTAVLDLPAAARE